VPAPSRLAHSLQQSRSSSPHEGYGRTGGGGGGEVSGFVSDSVGSGRGAHSAAIKGHVRAHDLQSSFASQPVTQQPTSFPHELAASVEVQLLHFAGSAVLVDSVLPPTDVPPTRVLDTSETVIVLVDPAAGDR